ncbi:MAG TPA: sigma-70 family RNA polymerase sigma factor [Pseudonocardiaceae bacterium]|nr:sigma-70 family RNA polymerase sigma factor [Pseudonocardiaceae bacterium]
MTTNRAALSVTELVRLAGADDQAAWQEIVRRYHGLVLARVRLFRLQHADAHDAVQMTWLRLVENCHRIQYPEYLGSWLATTASRECLSILRGITRTKNQDGMAIDNVADPTASPEQHAIDKHTMQILHDLVAELAPREQVVVRTLFSDQPPSYAELARMTGIPPGSLGPTRARALQKLHQKLKTLRLSAA